jgi:hypothetical protein
MSLPVCSPLLPILTTIQLIELWETFLLQLDADDEADANFYKSPPPAVPLSETSEDPALKPADGEPSHPATATDVALEQDA